MKNELVKASPMGKMRDTPKFLVGKPEGKGPLGKPRHRWEDNIKSFKEIGWDGVEWIDLAQNWKKWRVL